MKERVCQFGPERNLIGILTEPSPENLRPDFPVVIMLNAGLLHRIGPHGMCVRLGRRLAEYGVRSLRFDMGGYGDSEASKDVKSDEERVLADIQSAMDYLEAKQVARSFVLVGLCSGADNTFAVAPREPRVAGAVMLDGHGFWTPRSYMVHYLPRALRLQTWLGYARRSLSPRRQKFEEGALLRQQQLRRPFGEKAEVERTLQALVDRGMEMLYIYTGGVESYYNYAGQFFDMFKGLNPRGRIEEAYFPNADHTYTFAEDRERMFARVIEWYLSRPWCKSTAGQELVARSL